MRGGPGPGATNSHLWQDYGVRRGIFRQVGWTLLHFPYGDFGRPSPFTPTPLVRTRQGWKHLEVTKGVFIMPVKQSLALFLPLPSDPTQA